MEVGRPNPALHQSLWQAMNRQSELSLPKPLIFSVDAVDYFNFPITLQTYLYCSTRRNLPHYSPTWACLRIPAPLRPHFRIAPGFSRIPREWLISPVSRRSKRDNSTLPRMSQTSRRKRWLIAALKITVAAVIITILARRVMHGDVFERLLSERKDWTFLFIGWALVLSGFSLSFVRWYIFVRALGLDFQLRDAFRLGTLGFMLNQVSPGSIGGDLLKAVFIAREQHGNRTEAVATVVVDRAVGLFAMLIVGSIGLLLVDLQESDQQLLEKMRLIVWSALAIGVVSFSWAMSPWATGPRVREFADRLPLVGHTLTRLIEATATYHQRRSSVFAGLGLAMVTHTLLIFALWFTNKALPVYPLTLMQNASIVPPCLLAATLPVSPGGLGTTEGAFEFFYSSMGAPQGEGTIVALAYRVMTYAFAAVGACYYATARKKIDTLLHDAEELAEELDES